MTDSPTTPTGPLIVIDDGVIGLGPWSADLLPLVWQWENDPLTVELGGEEFAPKSFEQVEAESMPLLRGDRAGFALFAIVVLAENRVIGHLNVRGYDSRDHNAEFGIGIGDPADRGKGYGSRATRLALRFAFEQLGVHNIMLDTTSINTAAIRAYERAGFREIGRIRQGRRIGGRVADIVLMDCLASEWLAEHGRGASTS